jgi:hypothetical protein
LRVIQRIRGVPTFALVAAVVFVIGAYPANAQQDREAAESVASAWLRGLDQGSLPELFDQYAGPTLRQGVSKPEFADQIGIIRIQTGGPAQTREVVGGQSFHKNMQTGQTGNFYFFRYMSAFPIAPAYQDVYLEQVNGAWKVATFNPIIPMPPGAGAPPPPPLASPTRPK